MPEGFALSPCPSPSPGCYAADLSPSGRGITQRTPQHDHPYRHTLRGIDRYLMLSFVAQRLVKGAIVLLAILVLNCCLIRLAPGDPAVVMAGEAGASDKLFVTQLREKFGLDKPLPEQLFLYVKGILSLDLGFSFRQQAPVSRLIMDRLPATLLLTMSAFTISL